VKDDCPPLKEKLETRKRRKEQLMRKFREGALIPYYKLEFGRENLILIELIIMVQM